MIEVRIALARNWCATNREKYGNITRKLMKAIKESTPSATPKSQGTTDLVVAINADEEIESIKSCVIDQISKTFESDSKETGLSIICVDVETKKSWIIDTDTNTAPKAESKVSQEPVTEAKAEETKTEEVEKAAEPVAPAETTKTEESAEPSEPEKAEEPKKTAKKEKTEEKEKPAETPAPEKREAQPEGHALSEEDPFQERINEICNQIPMRYSTDLKTYIEELMMVAPALRTIRADDAIWSENLLVSINSGYGFENFANAINEILSEKFGSNNQGQKRSVKTFTIPGGKREEMADAWKQAVANIASMSSSQKFRVVGIDISECAYDLNTPSAKKNLRELSAASDNMVVIFKVPCVEVHQLGTIVESISDIMSVRPLIVPAVSIENMVDYVGQKYAENDFEMTDAAKERLESLIIKERGDDSFFGYETLDKLADKILYEKALVTAKTGKINRKIDSECFDRLVETDAILSEEDPYVILNNLVGITEVKKKLEEIIAQIKLQQTLSRNKSEGGKVERPCIHMMFTGNPGTGKTTVARLVAKILRQEGVLRRGNFFEIKGRDLCGRYVGETTPKTTAICRDAYGSVLFIDEAYALAQGGHDKDYGKEAVTALIAEMENHKDDMCVILAGYEEDMKGLYEMNEGFESRVPFKISFPNYNREELEKIFFLLLDGKFEYDDELKTTLENYLAQIPDSVLNSKSFSNGRFIRNLYERVWGKAAYRMHLNGDMSTKLEANDLVLAAAEPAFAEYIKPENTHKFGFSAE